MRKFLSLTLNTTREIIRQPVIAVLTIVSIATIGMLPVITVFCLGQEERIVRDSTVASIFVYGVFLVVASSVSAVFKQIKSGTAAVVLSKPVNRELFLLATFAGITMACALFVAINSMAAILSVRMALSGILTDWIVWNVFACAFLCALAVSGVANYHGRNFGSSLFLSLFVFLLAALLLSAFISPAGRFVRFGELIHWRLFPVALLLFWALEILAAIALVLSIRFKPVVVLSCCVFIFIVGLISGYLFDTLAGGSIIARFCSVVMPDWQSLMIYESLEVNAAVVWKYISHASASAVLYISAVLCLGFFSFKNAEI
jgi:hypothetical protein